MLVCTDINLNSVKIKTMLDKAVEDFCASDKFQKNLTLFDSLPEEAKYQITATMLELDKIRATEQRAISVKEIQESCAKTGYSDIARAWYVQMLVDELIQETD